MTENQTSPKAAPSGNGSAILSGIRRCWEMGQFMDFTIQVEDRKFPVHKMVIASVSDYFAAMLTSGMVEAQKDGTKLTEGVSADAMEKLLQFIYTDDMGLTMENVTDILQGAMFLQISTAIKECKKFMVENLSGENCFDVLSVFSFYSLKDGVEDVKWYLSWNFQTVFKDCQTNLLSYNNLKILLDNWRESEWNMFMLVKDWVEADMENRQQYLHDLLTPIRYCLMTPEELELIIKMELYNGENSQWTCLVDAAVEYHGLPIYKKVLYDSEQATVRGERTVALFSGDLDSGVSKFHILDDELCWKPLESLDTRTTLAPIISVIVVNNYLIICSFILVGYRWYIFNPRTMKWDSLGSPLVPKHDCAVAFFDGKLYVLGGEVLSENVKKSTEIYDFDSGEWSCGIDMPIAVTRHSACTFQGAIYVTGGRETSPGFDLSRMDRLDPASQTWESKAPMLKPRADHLMSVMTIQRKSTICVFYEDEFEFYDPTGDQWSKCRFPFTQALPSCLGYKEVMTAAGNTLYYVNCGDPDYDEESGICVMMNFPYEEGENAIDVDILDNCPVKDDKSAEPFCAALRFHHKCMDT